MSKKKNKEILLNGTKYNITKTIGEGGSGYVCLAESLGQKYAVKFLKEENSNKVTRFKNEIEFCKKADHENIVKIIGEGKLENELFYIMPYYSSTFRTVISNADLSVDTMLTYIQKIANGIQYIHKHNIIHRDIKPENILIENENLVLADFGIAHFEESALTKNSELLANRNYQAPEQKIKNNATKITLSADIYALGVIINECFTKQNPSGSQFKRISDIHPLLISLDNLVYNMMKQNPQERPTINEIVLELELLIWELRKSVKDIKRAIEPDFDTGLNKETLELILNRASEDILTAEYIFKSDYEIDKYNFNYHMKIGYTADDFLLNLYFHEALYKLCKNKFNYESNCYKNGGIYTSLNLENNEQHIKLYKNLQGILNKYPLKESFDLTGKILKTFSSCCDYHCEEILESISSTIKPRIKSLIDTPILNLIKVLNTEINENRDWIISIEIRKHIIINWDRTKYFEDNDDDLELFTPQDNDKEQSILSEFQTQWNTVFSKVDNHLYSVKFQSYSEYLKFKNYALNLSKPYYIFEGDVLDFIKIRKNYNDIVELELLDSFDITNTLSKILGLRQVL